MSSTKAYPCPYCNERKLETAATAPYVRGFVLAYQMGRKSYLGCTTCVGRKLRGEAGLSALLGWFSITSLIINPFLILYNLFQSFTVKESPVKVSKLLQEMGLPSSPDGLDITGAGCALAASMILADGEVEDSEIRAAEEIGEKIFGDFNEAQLHMLLSETKRIPSVVDMAMILRDNLDEEGKKMIYAYLYEIAKSDGNVSKEEKAMLNQVGVILGLNVTKLT